MTNSYYADPDEELQLEADKQAAQLALPVEGIPEQAFDPEVEDKQGPAFVEGASEEAQEKLQSDKASLPIWHPISIQVLLVMRTL